MTDSLIEKISDWAAITAIALGFVLGFIAWWFAREDADRKKAALASYQQQARLQMKGLEVALEAERNRGLELINAVSDRSLRVTESAKNDLRKFSGTNVKIQHLPDIECANTAAQIRSLAIDSGWKCDDPEATSLAPTILRDVVVYVKMFGDMNPEDVRVRKAANALVTELNSGGITTILGNPGTGAPAGVVSVIVGKRHSLGAALERKQWFEKIKADTGIDVEEQIRRAEQLSSSEDPAALLQKWSKETKPESNPK
jgi:hypothetical protein